MFRAGIQWVKGYAGQSGNERADKLANQGGDWNMKCMWWKRPFVLQDWSESKYSRRCANLFPQNSHPQGKRVRFKEDCSSYCEARSNKYKIHIDKMPNEHMEKRIASDGLQFLPSIGKIKLSFSKIRSYMGNQKEFSFYSSQLQM